MMNVQGRSDFTGLFTDVGARPPFGDLAAGPEINFANLLKDNLTAPIDTSSGMPQFAHSSAIAAFLKKMSSDFNVQPQQVLESLAKLSAEDLSLPPQENIQKIIQQFHLSTDEQTKAANDLMELLQVTEQKSDNEDMSPQLIALQMQQLQILPRQLPIQVPPSSTSDNESAALTQKVHEFLSALKTGPPKEMTPKAEVSFPYNSAEQVAHLQKISQDPPASIVPPSDVVPSVPAPARAKLSSISTASLGTAVTTPIELTAASSEDSMDSSTSDDDGNPYFTAQQAAASHAQKSNATNDNSLSVRSNFVPTVSSTNVKELIHQAQVMIKKGGGEMKIQLQPEGLGQVAMRVKVQDGQVSIQLITQNTDAKKIIEKGLGDLKTQLSSHRLDLATVKVDVARDLSQSFDHRQEQAQRQMAQQFLEDFRQSHQQKAPQFGSPYQKTVLDTPPPRGQIVNAKKIANSRRLDLVA